MTHYLLSVHSGASAPRQPMSEEETRSGYEQMAALENEMRTASVLVFSGRLTAREDARVVRRIRDRLNTTDGPYVETKEMMAGFYIIEAPDLEAALTWASKTSEAAGMPIEVRPFAGVAVG